MKYIVYCTTNIINKKIYIGVHLCKSSKFDGYLGCGVYESKPSSYNKPKTAFLYAVLKYGPKNFKRITIKEFDNKEDAFNLEADIVDRLFLSRKDVYNQVLGGYGGDIFEKAIPCYLYDLNGNFIAEFESQLKASIFIGRGVTTINRAIKEKIKAANYFWSLEKTDKLNLSEYKTLDNKIPVFLYSDTGEYDCCYESVSDAARVNNVASTNISRSCKLGYKCNGKYFSYKFSSNYSESKSEALKNRKVYLYSLSGEFIAEYESYLEALKSVGKQGLQSAIKLGRTFAGFQWKLEKLDRVDSTEIKSKARKVGQYDLNGKLIKIYNTVSECTKDFSGCRHVLSGKRKTSGGYIFKYIE